MTKSFKRVIKDNEKEVKKLTRDYYLGLITLSELINSILIIELGA
tara:strand:+ start:1552 stop:1686 length:135 start_codon:yes stop_codon:yes gene_type:complete